MSSIQDRHPQVIMNTYGPPKRALVRGQGSTVWDEDGTEYLDLLAGIAVNCLGHNHPALVEAISTQLQTLGHVSNFFATEPQVALAERLVAICGGPDAAAEGARVFFTNSGTEANEAAFKLTRKTGRTKVLAAAGSFHGRSMGALALTSKEAYRTPFEPLPGGVEFVPYDDVEAFVAAIDGDTAAVILEPVQGEAGAVQPADGLLQAARAACDEHGALLWFDEVQSGIGRTGHWLAHQDPKHGGVRPDIITLAKGLGGGFPVGACVALGEAGSMLVPGNHGTTYGGNPVAAAACLAVLDTIEGQDLMAHVVEVSEVFAALAANDRVADVRRAGLLMGVDLEPVQDAADGHDNPAQVAFEVAMERGFIINATGPHTLRLVPPLVLTTDEAQSFVEAFPGILDEAYARCAAAGADASNGGGGSS
ncbi:acetylornithine transaminase [Nocardioidaceae bacterium]|nr:acetylornithine transaminase [Nocardioidaceae bacterium]